MYAVHDFFTKHILEEAFDPLSVVELEKVISPADEQRADVYFEPRADRPPYAVVSYLGTIYRMAERRGLVELFSSSPSPDEVRRCLRKQLQLHQVLQTKAQQAQQQAQAQIPVPDLWLLCAGRPDRALAESKALPARDWPSGFYVLRGLFPLWFVVLPELPLGPETRLLRLCGKPALRDAAIAEIEQLEPDSPARHRLLSVILVMRKLFRPEPKTQKDTQNQEALLMTEARRNFERFRQAVYQKGITQGITQGVTQGIFQGKADDILGILVARGLPVSDSVRDRIRVCTDLHTLHTWLLRAVSATTAEEIFTAA